MASRPQDQATFEHFRDVSAYQYRRNDRHRALSDFRQAQKKTRPVCSTIRVSTNNRMGARKRGRRRGRASSLLDPRSTATSQTFQRHRVGMASRARRRRRWRRIHDDRRCEASQSTDKFHGDWKAIQRHRLSREANVTTSRRADGGLWR